MLVLLKDKPYMHSDAPRPAAVEDPEPPTGDDSDDEDNDRSRAAINRRG
jgi:hypothetical protein